MNAAISTFHFGFNLVLALIFILPLSAISDMLVRMFPEKIDLADPGVESESNARPELPVGEGRDRPQGSPRCKKLEVIVGRRARVELGAVQARHQKVEHAGRHEAVPAQRTSVHVAHDPVGVVRESADRLDAE